MSAHEVVIVGGGPAGASTALFLTHLRPDLTDRLVILERARYPRDKPCAGGVGARADRALEAIGVRVDVPSVWVHGVSASFQVGDVVAREQGIGRVVRRIELDEALARAARARGVRVIEGAQVSAVRWSDGEAEVESAAGTFRGRVIVGADGVGSVVRRAMGLPFGHLRAQAVEVDTPPVAADRPRDLLHFDMADRSYAGYSWDFPTLVGGESMVCRGVYVLHEGALGDGRPAPDAEAVLRARLASLGLSGSRCRVKRFSERGLDKAWPIGRTGALLVGEAAGIDPMLGEGIAQAIAYGALAGAYLAERLSSGDLRFDDWRRRVAQSTMGRDIRFRTRLMRLLYGPDRERVERYVRDEPSFLRFGMQYFGGKRLSLSAALRMTATGALLGGRIGLDVLWRGLPRPAS